MKILFTNHRLRQRGGSELFTLEVASGLKRRGHEVCVFSPVGGEISAMMEQAGLTWVSRPQDCPFQPELIHGQHHLETMAALAAWPSVPALYFAHGWQPWEEMVPAHPRLVLYVAPSPRYAPYIARDCGVAAESVRVLWNFFDESRFQTVREPGTSQKALLYHNTLLPDSHAVKVLRKTLATLGYSLDLLGKNFGNATDTPETVLPEFDIVFASGRSAIEALACGCTVVPIATEQAETHVHPGNFEELRSRNFAAEVNAPPMEEATLLANLRSIDPAASREVTRRLRQEATLTGALMTLEGLHAETLERFRSLPPPDLSAEILAYGQYLAKISAQVKNADENRAKLAEDRENAQRRAEKWKRKAETAEARLRAIQKKLRQSILGRLLTRKVLGE